MKNDSKKLSDKTVNASLWLLSGKLLARSLDVITLLILARLLTPTDFGLVAMAMIAVTIVEAVFELPVMQALVRIPVLTRSLFDTAFTLGLIRGMALAVILAGLAWPIAQLYQEPRLPYLICALAVAPAFRGAISPRLAIYIKNMDFRREFIMELAGKTAALLISITIAVSSESYWAIAAGTITTPVIINILSYYFAPYKPRLRLSEWHQFSNTVTWYSFSQLISAINWQLDRLLLAKFVTTAELGKYTIAGNISDLPYQTLVTPLSKPLMTAFSSLSESKDTLSRAYKKASNSIVTVTAPLLMILSLLATPLVNIMLGKQWHEASFILQWLAVIMIIRLPIIPLQPMALAMNRTQFIAIRMLLEFVVKLPVMVLAVMIFGITGALAAQGFAAGVALIVSMILIRKLIDLSLVSQMLSLWRPSLALFIMSMSLLALRTLIHSADNQFIYILLTISITITAVLIYLISLLIIWRLSGYPDGIEAQLINRLRSIIGTIRS